MVRTLLTQLAILVAIGTAIVLALWVREILLRQTPAEKLTALAAEVKPKGGQIFQTVLQGKPLVFLLLDCKVFLVDASGKEVTRTKVLSTGFYFWLDGCTGQSIKADGGFVSVYLANLAIGAGGGNTSGGSYRTEDGLNWEKSTEKGWRPVAEAQ